MGLALLASVAVAWPGTQAGTTFGTAREAPARASLWYRGQPAGVPRMFDLTAIRAAGFSAVTWPLLQVDRVSDLRRMAASADLHVVIRTEAVALTPVSALSADSHVDILIPQTPVPLYSALLWRAVAHGARVVSFDPGVAQGTGLGDPAGQTPAWVGSAAAVARQMTRNATMIDTLTMGPAVSVDPPSGVLDVVLLDAVRSWVLIATNTSLAGTPPVDTYAFLPRGVPPAEWLNLFDGSTIAMLRQPGALRWHVILGPGDARVYIIDKIEK
jgi:hypothetical protein